MSRSRRKTFNYAVGMSGTSIPITMRKICAPIFSVHRLGMKTVELSLIPLVHTLIDAADNPVYGFESGDNPGPRTGEAARFLLAVCPPVPMRVSLGFPFSVRFPKATAPREAENAT